MHAASMLAAAALLAAALLAPGARAQGARPNGAGNQLLSPVEQDDSLKRQRVQHACDQHVRTYDGSCNNNNNKLWGSAGTMQFSYVPSHSSQRAAGSSLKSARHISNIVCSQRHDRLNRRYLSEFTVFFGQFLDHTVVATPVNQSESMPIPIPRTDPIFSNFSSGTLAFHRSVRATLPSGNQRPINSLSSFIDLSSVYGADPARMSAMRQFEKGRIQTSARDLLQLNEEGLRNAPTNEPHYFLAGDHRANEHPVLTALHTLFVREHNRLCEELHTIYPSWNDDRLFENARTINIARFQKIVYEEFLPAMTGRGMRPYRGYNPLVDASVSMIFSTAAYRVGHTMVGNSIHRRDAALAEMDDVPFTSMFFRPSSVMSDGIEPFLRGALHARAQEVDVFVHDALRNFLFTGIPQESGFDLVALNIQRGRDHNLPTYNQIRYMVGRPKATKFSHITRDVAVQAKLATAYGSVDRVEAWVGLVSEDHAYGASMGPTMLRVWLREFERLRDGDRFFYARWHIVPLAMWWKVPTLRRMIFSRASCMRDVLVRNTNMRWWEVRRNPFFSWR